MGVAVAALILSTSAGSAASGMDVAAGGATGVPLAFSSSSMRARSAVSMASWDTGGCTSGPWFDGGGGVAAEQPLVHFQALLAGGPMVAVDGEEHPELGVCYPVVESGWGGLAWWVEVEGGPGIACECFAQCCTWVLPEMGLDLVVAVVAWALVAPLPGMGLVAQPMRTDLGHSEAVRAALVRC